MGIEIRKSECKVRIEWWDRDRFRGRKWKIVDKSGEVVEEIPIPDDRIECDLCDEPIKDFPCPVIFPVGLEYKLIERTGEKSFKTFSLAGGQALCKKCFEEVYKELEEEGRIVR